MNVYEEMRFPFLKDEDSFLKEATRCGVPVLGICLGAQLLAKALGARVKKAPAKEVGWYRVGLTEDGRRDPLFKGIPGRLTVFQWHEDTFEMPGGGVLIAGSFPCMHQAFRFGHNAYGLQFHIEVTSDMVKSWLATGEVDSLEAKNILSDTKREMDGFTRQARAIYSNFERLLKPSATREIVK